MSVVDCSKIPCKYSNKDCPFGKVCKYLHNWGKVSARSKPVKAGSVVKEHVKDVITRNPHLLEAKNRTMVGNLIKQSKDLALKRISVLAQKSEFEKKYVMVSDDKKLSSSPFDDTLKLVDAEFKALRGMAISAFGKKPVVVPLVGNFGVTNTAANLNRTALTLDCSQSPDWASCAALFDEVKTTHVVVDYFPTSSTLSAGAVPAAAVFAYDPEDLTVLASLAQGCSYSVHRKYMISQQAAAANPSTTNSLNTIHKLSIVVPKGDLIVPPANIAGVTFCIGEAWAPTTGAAGSCDPVGTIKWYETNQHANATVVGNVLFTYLTQFRMRF